MGERKTYSIEFQSKAVSMIVREGLSVAEVSRRLSIDYSVLWRWKKKLGDLVLNNNPPSCTQTSRQQEILELNAKLERVIEERDILMKALSHFITKQD